MPAKLYVIHAPDEPEHFTQLKRFLTPLINSNLLTLSGRAEVNAGDATLAEEVGIREADLVIFLVTQSFLIDSNTAVELAMIRAQAGIIPIVPVKVSHCILDGALFSNLVTLPRNTLKEFIDDHSNKDKVWSDVASELLTLVKQLPARRMQRQKELEELRDRSRMRILMASAAPAGATPPSFAPEVARVSTALEAAGMQSRYQIIEKGRLGAADLAEALLRHQPYVLHFTGHGDLNGSIALEGPQSQVRPLSSAALAQLFANLPEPLQLLVLNCCYAGDQATTLRRSARAVIGFEGKITATESQEFAKVLYGDLFQGRTVAQAFERARMLVSETANPVLSGDGGFALSLEVKV